MCLFSSCPLLYSKIHRSSVVRVLPWGLTFISKFLGVGLNFHDFNESKQPCTKICSGVLCNIVVNIVMLLHIRVVIIER